MGTIAPLFQAPRLAAQAGPLKQEGGVGTSILSGLGRLGRFLDIGTGAAFVRNVVGGDWSKALKTIPAVGLFTAPDRNYAVSGRELVSGVFDAAGIPKASLSDAAPFAFGAPGSGSLLERGGFFDFTARGSAGFVTEMILDPATYVGIGALTRTGRALQIAGKTTKSVKGVLSKASIEGVESLTRAQRKILPTLQKLEAEGADLFLNPTLAGQAAAGQRSLLTLNIPFTNLSRRIPTPFFDVDREVKLFERASKIGQGIRSSAIGRRFFAKPGSSTGFQNYNEAFKIVVNKVKGAERFEGQRAQEIVNELLTVAKGLPDDVVEKTPEGLAKYLEEVSFAVEMTDEYRGLTKEAQGITDAIRSVNDEFLQRDIVAGVRISNLGDAAQLGIDTLETKVRSLRKEGLNEIADLMVDRMAQTQRKIEGWEELVAREEQLALAGAERSTGRLIRRLEEGAEKVADAPLRTVTVGEVRAEIRGIEKGLDRLFTVYQQADAKWAKAEVDSLKKGVRTRASFNAEAQLKSIEKSIQRQSRLLQGTAKRLERTEFRAMRDSIVKGQKVADDVVGQVNSLRQIREARARRGGLDDLVEIEELDRGVLREARKQATDRTRHIRQFIRTEAGRLATLQRFSNRLLIEFDPNLVDIPGALRGELLKEFPMIKEGLLNELRAPGILKDAALKTRRVNATAEKLTKQINDLYVTAPQTDYYLAHVITDAGRNFLERNYGERFKGASAMWTTDHGNALRRMLPFDLKTVNEKMKNVLNGKSFFETNPGVILATRAGRTVRAEALADYARGLTQLDGVSHNLENALRGLGREGIVRRRGVREIVEEAPGEVAEERLEQLFADVFGRTDPKTGQVVRAGKDQYDAALTELDGILQQSGSDLRIPQNPKIRELWRRQGIDPVAVPQEIAFDTALLGDVFSGQGPIFGQFGQIMAAATRHWKAFTLFPWPAYHTRNFYSEHFLNILQGMTNPVTYAKHSADALWLNTMEIKLIGARKNFKVANAAGKADEAAKAANSLRLIETELTNRKFRSRFGEVSGSDVLEQYRINGLDDGYGRQARDYLTPADEIRARTDVRGALKRVKGDRVGGLAEIATALPRQIGKFWEKSIDKIANVTATWTEKHPRMTQFLWELENQGRTFDDAALEVVKRHYDYSSLAFTSFERKLRASVIPFFSWQRQNVPRMIQEFLKFPRRTTATLRLTEPQFTEEEKAAMPSWIRQSVKIRVGKDQVIHRIGLPFEDLMEWAQDPLRQIATSIHPAGQEAIRQVTGIDPFLKRRPQPFLGENERPLPAPLEIPLRTFAGRVSSVLRRGGQVQRGQLDPATRLLGELTGIRPRPFNPEEAQLQQLREKIDQLVNEGRVREFNIPFVPRDVEDDEARVLVQQFSQLSRERAKARREGATTAAEAQPTAEPGRGRRRRRRKRRRRRGRAEES